MSRFSMCRPILLYFILLWLWNYYPQVQGRALDAYELAIGDWDLVVTCPTNYFQLELFPPQQQEQQVPDEITTTTTKNDDDDDDTDRRIRPKSSSSSSSSWTRHFWKSVRQSLTRNQRHDCRLTIYPNGTFCFQPIDNYYPAMVITTNFDQTCLPIHGQWKVRTNPYCVTDRFYDVLELTSYPRIQRHVPKHIFQRRRRRRQSQKFQFDHKKSSKDTVDVTRKFQLVATCRLKGHFSEGGGLLGRWRIQSQRKRPMARLSHGTLLLHQDSTRHDSRPRVVASFWGSGQR